MAALTGRFVRRGRLTIRDDDHEAEARLAVSGVRMTSATRCALTTRVPASDTASLRAMTTLPGF